MTETTELKPVDNMTKAELRAELEQHGESPSGSITAIQLRERLLQVRAEVEPAETVEGVVVAESDEALIEPTPEEATTAALSESEPGQAAQLVEAESMALELRERGMAIGPQPTIPALGELNAISVVAERLASSGIVPTAYRNRPDDVVAAILMGRELGIGPMQSLKDIAVIDGRPALAAHLQLAVLRRAGVQIIESDVNDERAYIKARRPDGEVGAVTWSYEEATKVMRGSKPLSSGANWQNYRQDMLWARAVGRWTRRYGSDLVAGMPYTAEEVRDFSDDDSYGYGGNAKPVYRQDAPENNRPKTRAELLQRFAAIFGDGDADDCRAIAAWYIKEVLSTVWGVERFADLPASKLDEAVQKVASTVMLLEEESPDLALATGVRETIARAFARRLDDGAALVGPPWRLGPDEPNFPTWEEFGAAQPGTGEPSQQAEDADDAVADAGGNEPLIKPGDGDDDIPFGE